MCRSSVTSTAPWRTSRASRSWASRRRAGASRRRGATLLTACIAAGLSIENGLHEMLRDDPELRAARRRAGVELRDLRRPPGGLDCATGANLEVDARIVLTVGSDCAIGKMTVSLELDRAARARGLASRLRPHRADGDRDRGLGDRGRRRRRRLHLRAPPSGSSWRAVGAAATCSWWRARARSSTRRTPGSRSGSSTGRRRTCWCSAIGPGSTEVEGSPGHPLPPLRASSSSSTSGRRCPAGRARVVAIALNTAGLDDAEARNRDRGGRGGDGPAGRPIRSGTGADAAPRRRARGNSFRRDPVASRAAPAGAGGSTTRANGGSAGKESWGGGERALAVVGRRRAAVARCAGTAPPHIGANDDLGKCAPDAGAALYAEMASLGLRQTSSPCAGCRATRSRSRDRPTPRPDGRRRARSAGLEVVFATYPYPPREVEAGLARPEAFGRGSQSSRSAIPAVRQFVVGNEPNQPAFWRPQFAGSQQLSAADVRPVPRSGVRRPEGGRSDAEGRRRRPVASRERSPARAGATSPRRRSASSPSLGAWYRASGRDRPLMDGLSFHPYPNAATDPLDRGYPWPNAGFVNLDRVKQAALGCVRRHAQPTTVDGLRLYLDEVGWQVDTTSARGLRRAPRTCAVTDEGHAGAGLRRARAARSLRPRRRAGERLRLPRRRAREPGSRRGSTESTARLATSADAVRAAIAEPGLRDGRPGVDAGADGASERSPPS